MRVLAACAALALMVFAVASCGSYTQLEKGAYPVGEVRVARDGSEASVRLAASVSIGEVVDLRPFEGFYAGMTPSQAQEAYGEPDKVIRSEWETRYTYERDASVVEIVAIHGLSSATGMRVTQYEVRVPVQDPPFSNSLPAGVRQVWTSRERPRDVTVVSAVPTDPIVRFRLSDGRVTSMSITPSPKSEPEVKGSAS